MPAMAAHARRFLSEASPPGEDKDLRDKLLELFVKSVEGQLQLINAGISAAFELVECLFL